MVENENRREHRRSGSLLSVKAFVEAELGDPLQDLTRRIFVEGKGFEPVDKVVRFVYSIKERLVLFIF